ncbi:MAG: ATP-binding cassette domain-containing protein [Gemmatimonadaceae bacterium]|uniref:ABC transporter transmembrane domain-containing protein n=1 Tax=Caulobacter sp. DWP3-1-3b2 TaxID=2804643 RepID=UPI0019A36C79|nr:ATP-binding cassette domain-containing protein [Caulobacter sp.]
MMSDVNAGEISAEGRPSAGAELVQNLAEAANRRPRRKDIRPLAHLLPFVRRHVGDALAAGFFLLFSTGATLGLTGAFKGVIDKGFTKGSDTAINSAFLGLGAVAVLLAVATALRFFFVTRLGERVVADLRRALYGHTLKLDPAFFLKTRTGEVLSRMTTDITIIEQLVGTSVSVALRNILSLIGGLGYMAFVSPKLAGFIVLMVPVILAPIFLLGRNVRKLSVSAQDKFADAVGYAGESLDALDTVQAFGREGAADIRFGGAVEGAYKASVKRINARAAMTAVVMALAFCGVALLLWVGAHLVLAGEMTGGTLAQFALLAIFSAGSVGALGEVWGDVQKAAGAMERISDLLNSEPGIAAPEKPQALPMPALGAIAFENVTFAYPGRPDLPALRGFDLTVRPGETVALVGPSGAGKSTVLRLLLRFYDPQMGSVKLDGVDLRAADPAEVRARMALVAQDSPLFSGSALDNIRFGREDATEAEARAAAAAAQATGFLEALPEGFNTPVGERAKTLSGGQRQRLAIARALVRNAPILLLDEATSALDAENERLVQKALHDAMSGRTTLVIAHRLATVLKADRIVVMEDGRVVEQGTHAELSAQGGLYAKLARLQFGVEAA